MTYFWGPRGSRPEAKDYKRQERSHQYGRKVFILPPVICPPVRSKAFVTVYARVARIGADFAGTW